jgi:hypothetical protein
MEVYIDDFVQLAKTIVPEKLRHLSRAPVLHGIHSVFPPPCIGQRTPRREPSVFQKKLEQGDGLWTARKKIIRWVFDGARRSIELPQQDKVVKLTTEIHR